MRPSPSCIKLAVGAEAHEPSALQVQFTFACFCFTHTHTHTHIHPSKAGLLAISGEDHRFWQKHKFHVPRRASLAMTRRKPFLPLAGAPGGTCESGANSTGALRRNGRHAGRGKVELARFGEQALKDFDALKQRSEDDQELHQVHKHTNEECEENRLQDAMDALDAALQALQREPLRSDSLAAYVEDPSLVLRLAEEICRCISHDLAARDHAVAAG